MKWIAICIIFSSFFGLIGFLCWLFHSGWPLLLFFFGPEVGTEGNT